MDIKEFIGSTRKEFNLEHTLQFLAKNPKEISSLVDLATEEKEYPYPEYSSWTLIHLSQRNKNAVLPYLPQLIDGFLKSDNQTILRNLLKVITELPKSKYKEDELINRLFEILIEPHHKVALLVYSTYQLMKFLPEYPEFKNEIVSALELKLAKEKSAALTVALRNLKKSK